MVNNKKNILITGGAGFIGSRLANSLLDLNAGITIVDNLSTGSIKNIDDILNKIEFIEDDIERFLQKPDINLGGYDYIFHLAANSYVPPSVENPVFDYRQNLYNTFLLLEVLRKTSNPPHLFNASSAAIYGNPESLPIRETDPTVPIAPYGVSKLAAEFYATVYSKLYGIKVTNLRFFSVYGPGQHKQVMFDLLEKIRKNPNEIKVYGDGTQIRDFIYIDDLIKAILQIVKKTPGNGEVYNVASGKSYSISEVVQTLCDYCGVKPIIKYTDKVRPGDAEKWIVDVTKLAGFGFTATTTLEEGAKKVKNWFDRLKK